MPRQKANDNWYGLAFALWDFVDDYHFTTYPKTRTAKFRKLEILQAERTQQMMTKVREVSRTWAFTPTTIVQALHWIAKERL
jgi:hypothetical protein